MKHKTTDMDSWLESLGYYRKHIAHDETCLFRSVAEQIYKTQMFHELVRKECIEYADNNRHEFDKYVEDWDDYLTNLKNHMLVCGEREIQIVSRCYRLDITIFNGNKRAFKHILNTRFNKQLFLCLTNDDHFDTVYKLEFIETAGFCQSLLYKVLYENVFKMEEIDTVVDTMLYNKPEDREIVYDENNASIQGFFKNLNKVDNTSDNKIYAPFPFKVAKALDPDIYRNIEFDTWNEFRKEWRLNNWYNGDTNFKIGTRCIVELEDNENKIEYCCYVQRLNPCVVYIEKLAVYKEVPYGCLKQLPDAKPWMVPYRYTKSTDNYHLDPNIKTKKKKQKKKKNQDDNKENENTTLPECNNVKNYEGLPLSMVRSNGNNRRTHHGIKDQVVQSDVNYHQADNYQQYPNITKPYIPFNNNNYYGGNNGDQSWSESKPLCAEMLMGQTIQSHYNMYTDNNYTYYTKQITKETIQQIQPVYGSYYDQNQSYSPPSPPFVCSPPSPSFVYPPPFICTPPSPPFACPSPSPPFFFPPPSPQPLSAFSPFSYPPGSPMISPIYPNTPQFVFPPIVGCESIMTTQMYNATSQILNN